MGSIVEKWATLSQYFGSNLEFVDRERKTSLEEAFHTSAEAILSEPLDDFDLYSRAAFNVERRYKRALYKGNFFISWIKKLCSFFCNKKLIAAHDQFFKALATRAAEHYHNNFNGLLEKRKWTVLYDLPFLDAVIQAAKNKVLSRQENQGFFYKVYLNDSFKCFLIGTNHFSTQSMLQDQRFNTLLDSSHGLWINRSEKPCLSLQERIRKVFLEKAKFSDMDAKLVSLAQEKGLLISEIEKPRSIRKAAQESSIASSSPSLPHSPRRKLSEGKKIHTEYSVIESIEAWQQGDESYANQLIRTDLHPVLTNNLVAKKLEHWFSEDCDLLGKIKESKLPFCLAADISYLVGEKGLIERLEKGGLETRKTCWFYSITV